jgi:DNA primase
LGDSGQASHAAAQGNAYGSPYNRAGGNFPGADNWPRKKTSWTPGSPFGSNRFKREQAPVYTGPRTIPASRSDHAARLLLGNMALWETLAGEDHAMLCALPAPHGPLFVWLESQFHEHGALGWPALREHMQDQAFAEEASSWMAQDRLHDVAASHDASPPDPHEARHELRRLMNMLMIDHLQSLKNEALAQHQSGEDPDALARYGSLDKRWRELKAALASSTGQ